MLKNSYCAITAYAVVDLQSILWLILRHTSIKNSQIGFVIEELNRVNTSQARLMAKLLPIAEHTLCVSCSVSLESYRESYYIFGVTGQENTMHCIICWDMLCLKNKLCLLLCLVHVF